MKLYEYEGIKIKECRMALAMTGVELSKKTGFSQSSVSAWETGRCKVPEQRRKKLCQVLQTTWEYISMGKEPDLDRDVDAEQMTHFTPQPLATEFAFQCGQMVAQVDMMARQWRQNPHLLDGLNPVYREKLETIFEAVSL